MAAYIVLNPVPPGIRNDQHHEVRCVPIAPPGDGIQVAVPRVLKTVEIGVTISLVVDHFCCADHVQALDDPAVRVASLPGGGRFDEVVDADVVLARVLEDGEALAAHVLLRGRDPQVGDGSHGLSTERSVGYCIGRL